LLLVRRRFNNSIAALGEVTPVRPRPGSISMSTFSGFLVGAAASVVTLLGLSMTTIRSSMRAFSAISRAIAGPVTTGEVSRTDPTPPAASASASPNLAQQTPTAPAAIWRRAISTLL
jgi:hypothetical protein